MHARGELEGDPDNLGLAVFTALQGGLLMTQIRRDSTPLAVALDTMIDHIESPTPTP
jgi:TetR/AcrR family transcriptional repressor of nem operon